MLHNIYIFIRINCSFKNQKFKKQRKKYTQRIKEHNVSNAYWLCTAEAQDNININIENRWHGNNNKTKSETAEIFIAKISRRAACLRWWCLLSTAGRSISTHVSSSSITISARWLSLPHLAHQSTRPAFILIPVLPLQQNLVLRGTSLYCTHVRRIRTQV